MNSFELLQAMTELPNEQILSARDRLGYERTDDAVQKKHRKYTVLMVAAAILALLAGCAVAYLLNVQNLKVGEHHFYIPPAYDDSGNLIPAETRAPVTRISLQGANMEALAEWVAFTESYDRDGAIAGEADRTGSSWATVPDNYHITYGCYSQEMMDKLDELVDKYKLKLLSTYVICNYYESDVLLRSLGLESLLLPGSADIEYGSGYFFPEGSFDLSMTIQSGTGEWQHGTADISYRYSLKAYFDPVTGNLPASDSYTQWNYTTKNGQSVLLVLGEDTARIYADLPDAFISVYVDPCVLTDDEMSFLTASMLEELADLFDFSIQPQKPEMENVDRLKAEAQAHYESLLQERAAQWNAAQLAGYREFAMLALERSISPETMFYALCDINGDDIQELILDRVILSMANGASYQYFSLSDTGVPVPQFQACKDNVFEIYSDDPVISNRYSYYYKADGSCASFLIGLVYNCVKDVWYRTTDEGATLEQITAQEAQEIRDAYPAADFDWLPLKKYGEDVASIHYKDPYARYIASKMERYDNAGDYRYTLLDLNGDGTEELIAQDVEVSTHGEKYLMLSIHSVRDGKLWDIGGKYPSFAYLCEDNILEYTEDFGDNGTANEIHIFYRCTENGIEMIEKVKRDPVGGRWSHSAADAESKIISKEDAASILSAYKRIELEMKPFTEYPLR